MNNNFFSVIFLFLVGFSIGGQQLQAANPVAEITRKIRESKVILLGDATVEGGLGLNGQPSVVAIIKDIIKKIKDTKQDIENQASNIEKADENKNKVILAIDMALKLFKSIYNIEDSFRDLLSSIESLIRVYDTGAADILHGGLAEFDDFMKQNVQVLMHKLEKVEGFIPEVINDLNKIFNEIKRLRDNVLDQKKLINEAGQDKNKGKVEMFIDMVVMTFQVITSVLDLSKKIEKDIVAAFDQDVAGKLGEVVDTANSVKNLVEETATGIKDLLMEAV